MTTDAPKARLDVDKMQDWLFDQKDLNSKYVPLWSAIAPKLDSNLQYVGEDINVVLVDDDGNSGRVEVVSLSVYEEFLKVSDHPQMQSPDGLGSFVPKKSLLPLSIPRDYLIRI